VGTFIAQATWSFKEITKSPSTEASSKITNFFKVQWKHFGGFVK
jgi:hypothetical protein